MNVREYNGKEVGKQSCLEKQTNWGSTVKKVSYYCNTKAACEFSSETSSPPWGNAYLSQLEPNILNGFNDILLENGQAFCWSAHLYPERSSRAKGWVGALSSPGVLAAPVPLATPRPLFLTSRQCQKRRCTERSL